jgi:hypothetical protein
MTFTRYHFKRLKCYNKSILEIGAKPVDLRILAQWAGSLKALAVDTQ